MVDWCVIPSCPNYEASSDGDVRRVGKQMPLKPGRLRAGYLSYGLSHQGVVTRHLGHTLIAEAFHGRCPDGCEVNHIDRVKWNNAKDNLEYLTHLKNVQHAHHDGAYETGDRHWTRRAPERLARGDRHGSFLKPETIRRGTLNGCAKVTEGDVRYIKRMFAEGETQTTIAKQFGIGQTQVSNIVTDKQWRHL